ncbi:MAG: hypothetical protein KAY32_03565 [Candidatus Eisenbacteria sp.]|nr:hypothetical protein [Candidatus Eisenbacteria bacterium]
MLALLGPLLLFAVGIGLYRVLGHGVGIPTPWGGTAASPGQALSARAMIDVIALPLVIWGGICAGLVFWSVARLGRRIFSAVARLTEAARSLAPAPSEAAASLAPGGARRPASSAGDEMVELGTAFTQMATRVQAAYREVESLNRSLAAKVQQRTEELRQKNLALAFQNEKVIEADRLKSAFFASVSHELRTPLNAILALTEMLRDEIAGPVNPDQRKHLSMIYSSGESLLNLINEVLDLSRIEAGRMEVRCERTAVVDRLLDAVEELRPLAEAKGLTLTVEAHGQGHEALVDGEKVRLVLINLLGNAIKFSDAGTITARLHLLEEEHMLSVEVEDTGPGIPAEHQQQIFLEFHRVEMGASGRQKGTGLGLAVSKQMVNLMGGDIWVDSMVGKGSRFAFVIPLGQRARAGEAQEPALAAGVPIPEAPLSESRPRVLVVDADALGAGVLSRYLRQGGIDVLQAPDSPTARELLQAEEVEAILVKLHGGDKELSGLVDRLARDPALGALPVIVNATEALSGAQRTRLEDSPRITLLQGDHSVTELVARTLEVLAVTPASLPSGTRSGDPGRAEEAA